MIKVYCDSCGKEIDRDEKPVKLFVSCEALTGENVLEKHMHEGCAVCFLGADHVAAYEREEKERKEKEAQEKAVREARKLFPREHDINCLIDHPKCICLRCKKDNKHCCMTTRHAEGECPTTACADFEAEETEGGKV